MYEAKNVCDDKAVAFRHACQAVNGSLNDKVIADLVVDSVFFLMNSATF